MFRNNYSYQYITTYAGRQVSSIGVGSTQSGTAKGITHNNYDTRGRLTSSSITEAHITNSSQTGLKRKCPVLLDQYKYRYVSCSDSADVTVLFKKVIREINPPLAKNGGAVNEGCKVILPSGECYFAISYKGDIEGWRKQIEQGAVGLGLSIAKITQDKFLPSDSNEVSLSRCKFQFE